MSSDLTSKEDKLLKIENDIKTYGAPNKVKATIDRLRNNETWAEFFKDYPFVTAINPNAIKDVIIKHDYYSELTPKPRPKSTYTFENKKPPNNDNYHNHDGLNLLSKDDDTSIINLHGGKRKTHRKKKSKNSRKNKSRKTHLKSNRRR